MIKDGDFMLVDAGRCRYCSCMHRVIRANSSFPLPVRPSLFTSVGRDTPPQCTVSPSVNSVRLHLFLGANRVQRSN